MSLSRSLVAAAAAVALATAAMDGAMFRLEIRPPIAAGNLKDLKKTDKKAVLAVRARVCNDLANVQIAGTAEGLVNGARQSVPLTLTEINRAEAVSVVLYQWPENGAWVLHLKGSCSSPKAEASTLVPMSKGSFIRERTEVLGEPATKKQIEDTLGALARSQS